MLFCWPAVGRPRILISPENIQMNERRCGPPGEAEVRRQLRVRQSRSVLGGQRTPDPVSEGPAWSPKTANGPKFPLFSGPVLIDHWVCLESNEGKKIRRIFPLRETQFSQESRQLTRWMFRSFVPKSDKDAATVEVPDEKPLEPLQKQ